MKNIFVVILLVVAINFSTKANCSDVFELNRSEIENEFVELNQLEGFVKLNENICLSDIYHENLPFVNNLGQPSTPNDPGNDMAFMWGCCLGPIGVLILISSSNDPELVAKSIVGCLIPSALFTLGIYTGDPMLIQAAIEIAVEIWSSE